jgi:hypothetical protein
MARGVLTEKVKQIANKYNWDITLVELRLLPYIMLHLIDNDKINPQSLNKEELDTLKQWLLNNKIKIEDFKVKVTPEFYDIMVELLKYGYCEDMLV